MRFGWTVMLCTVASIMTATQGCDRPRSADAQVTIDSAIPRDEAIRRFQAGLARPESLTGGAGSMRALTSEFVAALERSDTAALAALALTRAEYAWLYYPTTAQGLPPYDLSPGLLWFTIETRGRAGLTHLLEQRAGRPLRIVSFTCDTAMVEGNNRVHGPCALRRLQAQGDTLTERLFGAILERDGRFKFLNYANQLD